MSETIAPATDPAAAPGESSVTKTNLSPEDQATFSALLADLTRGHAPEGAVEEHWVGQMAMVMLRARWADALEQLVVEAALSGETCKGLPASVLPRWRTRLEKDFRQAVRELEASKAQRRTTATTDALAEIDRRHAAGLAELERDPQAALARLMARQDPFNDSGTNEPEPPPRPLNRAQRRRLEARQRHQRAA